MMSSELSADDDLTNCPNIEDIENLLDNSLDDASKIRLNEHLSSCRTCAALMEEVQSNIQMLDQVRATSISKSHSDSDSRSLFRLPGYEILRVIFEGGQGIVYEARQLSTNRNVAIKVLLHGLHASKKQRLRFEREIDLAAPLEHPHIVPVFDSGHTEDGHMFLVMRYVEGMPFDVYLRHHVLGIDETLRLFVKIAQAVNYAHQRGVIHRDLKPNNILIDEQGEPHLLDFGLAKPLDAIDTENKTIQTQVGEFLGTLAYAAPEQVSGDPDAVDIRSDVYTLGVILFGALTGEHPYPIHGQLVDIVSNILDHDPPRPSSIRSDINDELDTILLRILDKDKHRRYQSVADLIRDLERFEQGLPIEAKADSRLYILNKMVKRHRVAVSAAIIVFLSLSLSTVVSVAFWYRAVQDRADAILAGSQAQQAADLAETESRKSDAVNQFMMDMLSSPDPSREGREVKVVDVLDKAAEGIDITFAEQPEVEISVRDMLGRTYHALGVMEEAESHWSQQYDHSIAHFGHDHPRTLRSASQLALIWTHRGQYQEAFDLIEPTYTLQNSIGVSPEDLAFSGSVMGQTVSGLGRYEEAVTHYKIALSLGREGLGEEHRDILELQTNLALVLSYVGRFEEALEIIENILPLYAKTIGDNNPITITTMNHQAMMYMNQGRWSDAEPILRSALTIQQETLTIDHRLTLPIAHNLATVYTALGQLEDAEKLYREVVNAQIETLGPEHEDSLTTLNSLARVLKMRERFDEAEATYRQVIEAQQRTLGEIHPDVLITQYNLGSLLLATDNIIEAELILEQVNEDVVISYPDNHWFPAVVQAKFGVCLTKLKKYEEAEEALLDGYHRLKNILGPKHSRTRNAIISLQQLYEDWEKPEQVEIYRALVGQTNDG